MITVINLIKMANYEIPHYGILANFLFLFSSIQIFSSALYCKRKGKIKDFSILFFKYFGNRHEDERF
jgi:hypothetical protein